MNTKPGGIWRLTMHGPDGKDYPNKITYKEIVRPERIVYTQDAGMDNDPGEFHVTITFDEQFGSTLLTMRSVFKSAEVRDYVVNQYGAIEGGNQTLEKLEVYINTQINMRKQLKTKNVSRVSTYLNFPRNTENAFNFYKSVFGGEFNGNGITRFGDLPPAEGMPALAEEEKKLILHIELPILGGHILMGSDAPESMGFKINFGNNIHINLEPETREETKKLFDALAAAGKVTMELQDMFWGAYYGSCTDKFGVQWMFNCTEKSR
jgi:PhnB protein